MPYKNKADQLACQRRGYTRHRKKRIAEVRVRTIRYQKENRQRMWNYLRSHPCVDCGELDPMVLQFDHLRDKTMAVSKLLGDGYSWTRILQEIKKCVVRCANCHFRKTGKEQGWYREQVTVE